MRTNILAVVVTVFQMHINFSFSMELFLDEKLRMHSFSPSRSNKKIVELKQYQEIDESSENVPTAKEQ